MTWSSLSLALVLGACPGTVVACERVEPRQLGVTGRTFHDSLSEMLSRSSNLSSRNLAGARLPDALAADSLSEVLQDLRLSGVSYGRCEVARPGNRFSAAGT